MLLYLTLGICIGLTSTVGAANYSVRRRSSDESYYPNINFSDTFDWKLLKEFSSKYRNVILSPISLKLLLALLYQGSSGPTQREFEGVLQYIDKKTVDEDYSRILSALQASERSEYLLNMGTCVFLDSQIPVNPKFEMKANQYYRTEIRPTNFVQADNASNVVNYWVEKLTNGKISRLVQPGDLQQTIMLAVNAIYFKGTWTHPFPKNQTYFGKFFVNSNDINNMETVRVPYMSTKDHFFIKESFDLDAKILRLPYRGSDYSMFIVLPNSLGGLPNLIRKINLNSLSSLLFSLEKRLVEVNIPKFKLSFKASLGETLEKFGLRQMFTNTASFTGITKGNNSLLRMLVVSDIVQKSGIELDEEGSVVYSATDVNIGNKFGEATDIFNATHPFLFFIEGPNGSILFNGKIENPAEQEQIPISNLEGYGFQPPVKTEGAAHSQPRPQHFVSSQNVVPVTRPPYLDIPQVQNISNLQPEVPNQVPNLDPITDNSETDRDELLYRFNLFDIELLSAFSDSSSNVFISPASIKTTLAMILEGARGSCAQEISEALRIPDMNRKGIREILMSLLRTFKEKTDTTYLEATNAIFASDKYKIVDKYRRTIEDFYSGNIKNVDFKNPANAIETINNWVSGATHGAIKEIVGPQSVSSETSVVIANALYFKGKWKTSFESGITKTQCFHTSNGCVLTPMMRVSSYFNYSYISKLRAHAIEIPYENKFSMLILLPSQEASIRSVIRDLSHFKLTDILNKLKTADIILEFPKFKFDYATDLVENLKSLRIREIFGSKANLSGIIEDGSVLVNSLIHKTRIEVDEEGTVAAAATGAIVIPLIGSTAVIINRPFIFCIYHQETAHIVFEGILLNPQEQSQNSEVVNRNRAASDESQKFSILSRHFK